MYAIVAAPAPAVAAAGPASVLRPYQASVIDRAVELYGQGTRRLLVPLATGLGKTVVFTHLPQVCITRSVARTRFENGCDH